MKKYFSFLLTIAVSFSIALSFSSCQAEIEPESEVETGLPVEGLTFTFSTPMDEVVVTKASAVAETQVLNFSMIFIPKDDSGAIVITKDLYNEQRVTETNYLYSVSLSADDLAEIHTGQYYLYAIANTGNGFISVDPASLSGMKKNQIDNVIIRKADNQIAFTDASVLMSGKYCESGKFGDDDSNSCNGLITLHSGENKPSGRIHLRRAVSKSIFTIKTAADVEFKPVSYDVVNFAQGEFLFEKAGAGFWNGSIPGSVPAVSGVEYISRRALTNFETNAEGNVEFSFYMPESVQRTYPTTPTSWTYASRETRNYSESEHYGPFSYAPANAAYIVVRGSYKDSQYTGDATYTIHLGDFGVSSGAGHFDNFTVRRNYKYNYAVTVNSVNKIIAEAQSSDDSEQPGAEGNIRALTTTSSYTLDAHYETVLVSMPYDGADEYTVMAETPFGRSQVSRAKGASQITASDKAKLDYKWIRFAKPTGTGSSMTAASYPGETGTVDVYTLLDEIVAGNSDHCTITGTGARRTIYTVAYVNENYYDANPITGGSVEMIEFVNKPNRSLTAAFAPIYVSRDEHSTFAQDKGFTISQRAIRTFFNLDETKGEVFDNPFGIETVEETVKKVASGSKGSDTFGWDNYAKALASATSRSWSTYVNVGSNVVKTEGDTKDNQYRSDIMASTNAYYQCLSRNRDENNNGRIDDEEIKWYLPSHVECVEFWYGMNGLEQESRLPILGDTDHGVINYATSSGGQGGTWWANEGTAFGEYSFDNASTVKHNIRCVRALGKGRDGQDGYNQPTSLVYSYDGNNTIDISGLDERCSRGAMSGEYEPHYRNNQTYDLLPVAFEVAETNLVTGGTQRSITIPGPQISVTADGNGVFSLSLQNRSSYSNSYSISINGGTPQNLAGSYSVSSSDLHWSNDEALISVKAVITQDNQTFESNVAEVVVSCSSETINVPAPSGTLSVTRRNSSSNGGRYDYSLSGHGYPNDYEFYWTATGEGFSKANPAGLTNGTIAFRSNNTSVILWVVPKGMTSVVTYAHSTLQYNSGSPRIIDKFNGSCNLASSFSVGTPSSADAKTIAYRINGTNRFTFNQVLGNNLCATNYSQDPDGSDKGQWRIPNEKELGLMLQYCEELGVIRYTCAVSQYMRQETTGRESIFTIAYANNSYYITTSALAPTNYYTDAAFYVRCVRDASRRSDQGGGSGSGGSGDGEPGGGIGDGGTGSGSGSGSGSSGEGGSAGGV